MREKMIECYLKSFDKCLNTKCRYCEYFTEPQNPKRRCQAAMVVDDLIANGVTVQKHGYWETVVEVRDNTACGDGVKIKYKRCSCCKNPYKFLEDDFCGKCGAKLDLPEPPEGE